MVTEPRGIQMNMLQEGALYELAINIMILVQSKLVIVRIDSLRIRLIAT